VRSPEISGITDARLQRCARFVGGIGDPGSNAASPRADDAADTAAAKVPVRLGPKKRLAGDQPTVNSAALDHTHDQDIPQTSKMAHDRDYRLRDHLVLLVFR
jgi:hypothetical protein